MASPSSDSEQWKLCQSLTPPASQPDRVSLQKKALSALGKSSDAAICIPSDVESDTEDENDESQEPGNLRSCETRASTPDYLDLTGIEYCATEPEAITGIVTAPTVLIAQEEATPAWQASQDTNFATPPHSPESQPSLAATDGQEHRPTLVSERSSNMIVDAVSAHGACHDDQGYLDSLSTGTHSLRTTSPVEVSQASPEANKASTNSSHDYAISKAHTPSPARSWSEPHEAQGLGDASCVHAASEVVEAEFESLSEAPVSSPSLSPRRSPRKFSKIHKTMQFKDGDADSESSGSEDGLNELESHCPDEYSPSLVDSEDSSSEGDDGDGVHQGRKRRKVSIHSTAASSRGSRSSRQRRSTRHAAETPSGIRTSGRAIHSPTPSQATPAPAEASMPLARFEEWPLRDVFLKRITEGAKTTFQLQFDWASDICPSHAGRSMSKPKKRTRPSKTLLSVAKSSGARWTPEEDETVRRMRQEGDSWAAIQRALPHRSEGTIQVRYSTKLRG
ncbi:Myb-like domain-containing protein [Fusarium sp. LHS14.1]|nr:Myb-like domain-containing protein [Fusarium sp. LHS14.1]